MIITLLGNYLSIFHTHYIMNNTCSLFYDFSSRNFLTTFSAWPIEEMEHSKRMMQNLPRGQFAPFVFPIVFKQVADSGKRFRDFLDNRTISFYLISERTVVLLEDNGITGWKTYPIELFDKKGNQVNGYQGFSVIGRAGILDGIKERNENRTSRLKFYLDRWDGTDFFSFENTRHIITTQKVRDLFKKNKVDAVQFSPIEEWGIDLIV